MSDHGDRLLGDRLNHTTDSCAHLTLSAIAAIRAGLSAETFMEMAAKTWAEHANALLRLESLLKETRIPEINKGDF